jgi:hypothetical protein
MNDKELHQYCQDWSWWCYTRKYYIAPGALNILARMQPRKIGNPPDARINPDMQFFNMAIHFLADMQEHKEALVCFNLFYVEHAANIKREAGRLGISRPTYYNRAKAFARKAYSLSVSLKKVHESMAGQAQEEMHEEV